MKPILCSCCGALITCPVFVKGLPYGYSCAKKQGADVKTSKTLVVSMSVTKATVFGAETSLNNLTEASIRNTVFTVVYNDKRYTVQSVNLIGDSVALNIDIKKQTIGNNANLYKAMFDDAVKLIDADKETTHTAFTKLIQSKN